MSKDNVIIKMRKDVQTMNAQFRKRMIRLEHKGYTDTPAYKAWEEMGKPKFSVRGKSENEIQSQYYKLRKLLDMRTSTVRGYNAYVKELASGLGIKGSIDNIRKQEALIFKTADKIKQYAKSINMIAESMDYKKILKEITKLVELDNKSWETDKKSYNEAEKIEMLLAKYINEVFNN
jgi:hypothetical protein